MNLSNLIGIGNVTAADDTGDVQLMQITEGAAGSGFMARITDKVRRFFAFGFTSVPPQGSQALLLRQGGDRSCSIIIGTSHLASRPKGLQPGDTAMYDVRGAIIKLSATGTLIDAAGLPVIIQNASKITLDAPEVEITGKLSVKDDITALTGGTSIALGALRDTYNTHDHMGVATGTAKTDPPGEQA